MSGIKTSQIPPSLSSYLRYDPRRGKFFWKIKTRGYGGTIYPGDEAGTLKDGYVIIKLDGTLYRAHRLAWYMMTGDWLEPKQDIDHINGKRSDNRWHNLRLATRSENNHNPANQLRSDNKSGHRGVSWRKDTEKWHARIKLNGRIILLGDYTDLNEAVAARKEAERRYY